MDIYEKDPVITRAMALALMRQAHELLQAAKEQETAAHLQLAIDVLLRTQGTSVEPAAVEAR